MLIQYTNNATTPSPRQERVEELTKQFISRGVSPHTARAWAEAETPKDYHPIVYYQ